MSVQKLSQVLSFCLIILSRSLFSQIILEGVVTNTGSEPVVNALVELTDQSDDSRKFSDYTNEQGEYSIQITETGTRDSDSRNPDHFRLLQNYPNPFNPSTVIAYELPQPANIRIEIHNILGQKVRTLFKGFQSSLSGQVMWDGTNDQHQGVPAGVYIYSLNTGELSLHRKMLLIDGGQSVSNRIITSGMDTDASSQTALARISSDVYSLIVTGEDIETYEQQDLGITANMVLDITVYRTVKDIDGNVYRTVKIGNQWWMAENLKVTHYRNNDPIPNVTDNTEWSTLTTGAFCNYNNDENNVVTYGRYYNWYAVNDSRNIAPEGWHVPTDEEWKQLEINLGMSQSDADQIGYRGTSEGGKLKEAGTVHWQNPNTGATNESGFSGLPGGYRDYDGGFCGMGSFAYVWASTEGSSSSAWWRGLDYDYSGISRYYYGKQLGFSIRCVRD